MKNFLTWIKEFWIVALTTIIFGISLFPLAENFSIKVVIPIIVVGMILFLLSITLIIRFLEKHPHYCQFVALKTKWKLLLFFIIFCAYFLLFVFWFPGTSDNDATDIFKMLSGEDPYNIFFRYHGLNDHHSLGYCIYYFIFYELINRITGNYTFAVGSSCFVQILIASFCITRAITIMYQATGKKWVLIVAIIFSTLNPLVLEMTVTHWKDAMFGPILLMVVCELFMYVMHKDWYMQHKGNYIILAVGLVGLCLLRNNGIFISLGVLLCLFITNKRLRKFCISTGCALITIGIVFFGVKIVFNVQNHHFSETVGVPIQQIAKTAYDTDCTDNEFIDFFNNILDSSTMKEKYGCQSSDLIKFDPSFNDDYLDQHKLEFFKNYITLGIKHPVSYLKGWLLQTKVLWSMYNNVMYPFVPGNDMLHANPTDEQIGLASFFANFLKWYNPIYNAGCMFWICIVCFVILTCLKRKTKIPLLPLAILLATLFLAIPSLDFRYVYGIHLCLPVLFCLVWFLPSKININKECIEVV